MLSLTIPKKIAIEITEEWIKIEGPLGCKQKKKAKDIKLVFDNASNKLWFLNTDLKQKHFYFAMINKMILGVLKGFSAKLNIRL